jgi:hypothetical protein
MKKTQSSKLNSLLALKTLFAADPDLTATLVALEEAAQELTDTITAININVKVQSTPSGAAKAKKDSLTAVGDLAYEIAGGVHSFAEKSADAVLAARVGFSRSAVTAGAANDIVARIQWIIDAATENLESLADHGVTQAKVNSLKQRLKTYDGLRTMPRHAQGVSAAATKQLKRLFRQSDRLLKNRIDKLVWQFRSSTPEFYHKYQVARSIVDAPTSSKEASVVSVSNPAPATKAA